VTIGCPADYTVAEALVYAVQRDRSSDPVSIPLTCQPNGLDYTLVVPAPEGHRWFEGQAFLYGQVGAQWRDLVILPRCIDSVDHSLTGEPRRRLGNARLPTTSPTAFLRRRDILICRCSRGRAGESEGRRRRGDASRGRAELGGCDVLVEPEEVFGVVRAFERLEPIVLRRAVRLTDALLTFVHEEVHVDTRVMLR
jgi:hypothetical protein